MNRTRMEYYVAYLPDPALLHALGVHTAIVTRRMPGHDVEQSRQILGIVNEEITRRQAGWAPWVVFA